MRPRPCATLALLWILALLPQSKMSGQTAPPQNAQPSRPAPPQSDYEQFVAYWTTETGWHSELQLRNNVVGSPLTVTPVLRTTDGAETSLPAVTIQPQEVKSIDIDAAIASAAPHLLQTYGSLVLRYHASDYRNLYAALMVRNAGHPFAFHIDGRDELVNFEAASHEGVWWLPTDTTSDYIILTNFGQNPIAFDLSLYDASGKQSKQKLALGPRQTSRFSVRQLVRPAGLTGSYGGIKIFAGAHSGSLQTLHILFDETAGFSAIMKMFDQDPNPNLKERDYAKTAVWTLRAPMLALSNPDPSLAFPPGTTLRPQLFVRNTMSKPADVALRFNWRSGTATGKAIGPALRLNPFETRRIDVAALQDGKTLPKDANWTSVTLTTNGLPDEVMAVAASYDDTLRYGAQTPFSDQLTRKWAGGMWEYDAQHNSFITAGNGGTKPMRAAFTIFYNQGAAKYELEQSLQPDEQMWIDVGKLMREHVPDKNGTALPVDLAMGSYEFRDLTNHGVGTLFEGKVIYDKTYGHVAYGCAVCCAPRETRLTLDPLGVPLSGGSDNGVQARDSCTRLWYDISDVFYGNWNTASHSIATVNVYGHHTGMAVGSTTSDTYGDVEWYRNYCPIVTPSPSGSANVLSVTQSPVSLNLSSGDTGKTITVTIRPSSFIGSLAYSTGLLSNPNSSPPAAAVSVASNAQASGTVNSAISVSGTNSPSGFFHSLACVQGVCANSGTDLDVPPQVLLQVLYGEAQGQARAGDSISEPAIGASIKNRFGRSEFPGGSVSTYQAVIVPAQYAGIATSLTTSVEPELDNAVALFNSTQGDIVAGSPCFFSPTASGWSAVYAALNNGTSTVPNVANDPLCYASNRQLVFKTSIGTNINGNGAPAFIFERQKGNSTDHAVVQIP